MSSKNPACDATCPNYSESPNRILELGLEVKRLRSVLEDMTDGLMDAGYYAHHAKKALSTPPPALAEAYVRLRDAVSECEDERFSTSSNRTSKALFQACVDALAEIEGLERGE